MDKKHIEIIKNVIKENLSEAGLYLPPTPTVQPSPAEARGPARLQGQTYYRGLNIRGGGSVSGSQVQPTRAQVRIERPAPRTPTVSPQGAGGTLTGKVSTSSGGLNKSEYFGKNIGTRMAGSKQTSDVVRGMTTAGNKAALEKGASAVAGKVAGSALRALTGPAATAAMAVMEPTPAGEKKSEFQRQADIAKGISYEPKGRSISKIEADLTPKKTETPKVETPKVKADVPLPPSARPEYFSRGQAFKAARSEVGGGEGKFSYGGKQYQTNVPGEAYKPAAKLKTTSVTDTESGRKKIKEDTTPLGTTGHRTIWNAPKVDIRMADKTIKKLPPGKSGSSGGGDEE